MSISTIGLGHFLPGGTPLIDGKGVNETYTGVVETAASRVPCYVKFLPGRQLVNELFASVLAQLSGLPTPRAYLVLAQKTDYPTSPLIAASGLDHCLAFASEGMSQPTLMRKIRLEGAPAKAQLLTSWNRWAEAAAFDEWIANGDRHEGNLLVGSPGDVWLIDHSHAFTGPDWRIELLALDRLIQNQICTWANATLGTDARLEGCNLAQRKEIEFSTIDLELAADAALIRNYLTADEVTALIEFVRRRASRVASAVRARLGMPGLPLEIAQ